MKRFSLLVLLAIGIWVVRRLNQLVADVTTQKAQIEELQLNTKALRAILDAQRETLDEMLARMEAAEVAAFGEPRERMERWNERLADLDSPN